MPGLRRTSVIALAGGIMLLTGCQDEDTGSAATPAAGASAEAAPRVDAPATVTEPSSGSVTPSDATPASTSTPKPVSSASERVTKPASAPTGHPVTPVAGCRNLDVGDEVKAAVTRAYQQRVVHYAHIEPAPHSFFYGQCGTVRYAATRFQPFEGATMEELVGMQDAGSVTKYFRSSGSGWDFVGSDDLPVSPRGCADVPAIPRSLAAAWGNCSVEH
ncbi:hypothetical protein [Streptomyces sp. NPDC002580]|uniref:hypothetical protein n=1 Tax=Streptomyces sp. NPDC002580 TaxID=3364653 RepID=UPI0036C9ADDB